MHTFGFNIWVYFSSSCFKGYEDGEHGFYQVYREVFERIKTEERKAFNNLSEEQGDQRKLEGFGDSTTSIDNVLRFYDDWNNFTTYKTRLTDTYAARWRSKTKRKDKKKRSTI
jgi:DnaJ family protein A protein 5